MADNNIFDKLKRMFSTGVIVRRTGGGLRVVDVRRGQTNTRTSYNDRYAGIHSTRGATYTRETLAAYNAVRQSLYRDYDAMDLDPIISSALDIYSDESTTDNEFGEMLSITSNNQEIKSTLNNLFYDILNIEFNLWTWIRNLCKYGDFFLLLDIHPDHGIVNTHPISTYEMSRLELGNPEDPFMVKYLRDQTFNQFGVSSASKPLEYDNYQIAHFRLLADTNFLPYGKSMLEGARREWKRVNLMEDAMLIHRIMRAPERRIFKIDVGSIQPGEVDAYMDKIIQQIKKVPFMDPATGDYNLKFNMQNILEDFYIPVRGGDSGTAIETLSGLEFNAIDDIEYLRNKMMSALKIPKAFLGYEEGIDGKATLAAEDIRFARTIQRIQKILVSELTKIALIHLVVQGHDDAELVNFELELTNPSVIYEQEKIALWSEKVALADAMRLNRMMSDQWIYENIYNLSPDEWKSQRLKLIQDLKFRHRSELIEVEGADPANEDAEQKPASAKFAGEEDTDDPKYKKGGRPKDSQKKPGTDKSSFGRDATGKKDVSSAGSLTPAEKNPGHEFKGSALTASYIKQIKSKSPEQLLNEYMKSDENKKARKLKSILDETNIDEEISNEKDEISDNPEENK